MPASKIYRGPQQTPNDEGYETGTPDNLVTGASARLLDARRTPLTVTRLNRITATFEVRVEDFEDVGAIWTLPVGDVAHLQFRQGSPRNARRSTADVVALDRVLGRPLRVRTPDPAATAVTAARTRGAQDAAAAFIAQRRPPRNVRLDSRSGSRRWQKLCQEFLQASDLAALDDEVARGWASYPRGYETVVAQQIVLAQLGLGSYHGPRVRDPKWLRRDRSRLRRTENIVQRLGFIRAMFAYLGHDAVPLWRGLTVDQAGLKPSTTPLVSATFSRQVAQAHFDSLPPDTAGAALLRAHTPVQRIYMSYLETSALNQPFREAEAVVLSPTDTSLI